MSDPDRSITQGGGIAVLPPHVARRIAAGEVIERPASVARELIDNSIDAGAQTVSLSYQDGGLSLLRVHDDGRGMNAADLALCWKPHATSKIRSVEDLERSTTLGFRGEALGSVASVSELTVVSRTADSDHAQRIDVRFGTPSPVTAAAASVGTTVEVRNLFANLAARRTFMGSVQAESAAIRNAAADKIIAFPELRFDVAGSSGSGKTYAATSLPERVAAVYGPAAPPAALHELTGSGEGFSYRIVAAEPAIVRRDRRLIRSFVNQRRIWEFQLTQAIEYAYQDVQHGGLFPVAALFVTIDPSLVDFNIHPAKREARIRNLQDIRHRVIESLRTFLRTWSVQAVRLDTELVFGPAADNGPQSAPAAPPGVANRPMVRRPAVAFDRPTVPTRSHSTTAPAALGTEPVPGQQPPAAAAEPSPLYRAGASDLRYVGTIFETFLVVERGDTAVLIDQHAAHERLLYDRFRAAADAQRLLVPEPFATDARQDASLTAHRDDYAALGIALERRSQTDWVLTAIPSAYRGNTADLIATLLDEGWLHERFERDFVAELACKAALKAGDYLDDMTALDVARRVLELEEPRCPHGRPLWIGLDRADLERLIGRR